MESDVPNATNAFRDHMIMWVKDVSRSIDYIETRPDLDHSKLAYYGLSWGAEVGGVVPAVKKESNEGMRFAAGGIHRGHWLPKVYVINFCHS